VRTAQAYMRVASWASNKGATVAHLSPSVLYLLSASSTPANFVTDVLNRAESGDYMAPAVMRRELRKLRVREQQEHLGPERVAPQASRKDSKRRDVAIESKCGGRLAEFVAILKRELSAAEFTRVQDIVISDVVLCDPQLAQALEWAFLRIGRLTESEDSSSFDDASGSRIKFDGNF
jgi:hypothetical protein